MRVVLAALVLLAVAHALPYTEDSWDVEDELLQRIHQDSTPASLLLQKTEAKAAADENHMKQEAENAKAAHKTKELAVAHAKAIKDAQAKGAESAAQVEEDWTKKEVAYAKQAKTLNKDARAAKRDMEASMAKDKKDLKADEMAATKKIAETNKGTQAAQDEYDTVQAEYKGAIAAMKAQDKIAAKQAKAKAAEYKAEMDELKGELDGEETEGRNIQKKMVKDAKDLKQKKKDIATNYKDEMATLAKQAKVDREKLERAQVKEEKKLAAETKDNAARAAAASKAVSDEKKKNELAAAQARKQLNDRYAKEAAAKAKAQAIYAAKKAAADAALHATREGTAKKFQKKADDEEEKYKKAMAKAASMQAKADHAHATWQQAMDDAKKEDAARDAAAARQAASDGEMASCKMDGSECEKPDGSCVAVGDKGPYLAADLVTCTDKKPKDQQYAGESWAGIPPPAPIKPIPAPSAKCLKLRKAFMATEYGKAITKGVCPTVAVACHKVPRSQLQAKKAAMNDYFALAAACPRWCAPGTATNDGDNPDTHGICITASDVNIFKQQIADLPEWKAMSTNTIVPSNFGIISICDMAKNFLAGFVDGTMVHSL